MFDVFETSEVHTGSWGARLNVVSGGIRLDSSATLPTVLVAASVSKKDVKVSSG